jgi:thiol-disulfide isomerase/thioredoxin
MKFTLGPGQYLTALTVFAVVMLGYGLSTRESNLPPPRAPAQLRIEAPHSVPALSFADGNGKMLTLADFKGKVVLLDIWATWCVPCRAEFPRLDRLQEILGQEGLQVVPVSVDRPGAKPQIDKFYEDVKIRNLSEYLDPLNGSAIALGLQGVPTALIIDREGREIARVEGEFTWDSAESQAALRKVLGAN